jgi:hypothetical protein
MKLEFPPEIFENTRTSDIMEIQPVGAELFHAQGQTDWRTNMTKLRITFRSFKNAPDKNDSQTKSWSANSTTAIRFTA